MTTFKDIVDKLETSLIAQEIKHLESIIKDQDKLLKWLHQLPPAEGYVKLYASEICCIHLQSHRNLHCHSDVYNLYMEQRRSHGIDCTGMPGRHIFRIVDNSLPDMCIAAHITDTRLYTKYIRKRLSKGGSAEHRLPPLKGDTMAIKMLGVFLAKYPNRVSNAAISDYLCTARYFSDSVRTDAQRVVLKYCHGRSNSVLYAGFTDINRFCDSYNDEYSKPFDATVDKYITVPGDWIMVFAKQDETLMLPSITFDGQVSRRFNYITGMQPTITKENHMIDVIGRWMVLHSMQCLNKTVVRYAYDDMSKTLAMPENKELLDICLSKLNMSASALSKLKGSE